MPGLDGTGELFAPLLRHLPDSAHVVSYPFETPGSWQAFVEVVVNQVNTDAPFVLFAESFSGPVAVRFLAEHGDRCVGFLACATFLSNPAPIRMGLAALPGVLSLVPRRPPSWALRRLLLSSNATPGLTGLVADSISKVPRRTLLQRLRLIRTLSPELHSFEFPVIYLRGEQDRLVGQRSEHEFAANLPGCSVEHVSGPHLLAQECPQAVARLLMKLSEGISDP